MPFEQRHLDKSFSISWDQHVLEGLVHRWPGLWGLLGDLESWFLRDRLREIKIQSPIYVAGLARSGSTMLLEFLAQHRQIATHRYRDFPLILTPYLSDVLQRHTPCTKTLPTERAHGDGLMITPDSPEAMEEAIWMAFFDDNHNSTRSQVLDHACKNPKFERFYRDHIQKILLIRNGSRYASKGNYNITRLPYLIKLFPSLRSLIPIRRPVNHIASLVKQHRLFVAGEKRHPRALQHMQRVGHFEFGLDRRPINVRNDKVTEEILDLWDTGDEVRGWARYWANLYGWLLDELESNLPLRAASMIIRYEDLCQDTQTTLARLLEHVQLDDHGLTAAFSDCIHAPQYYQPDFTEEQLDVIREETSGIAARFGYPADASAAPQNRYATVAG